MQVDKTQSNRNFDEVKDFIIGVDFIEEISENKVQKNRCYKRLAKKEIDVDDLMNGTYIKSNNSQNSSTQNVQKKLFQDSINESKQQNELDVSRCKSIDQSFNSINLNNILPQSPCNKSNISQIKQQSEQMYKSRRILTPDRISMSVQQEFQITSDLMNQDIKELVNERIIKIKEDESGHRKSSAFRKSFFIENQLKKYASFTKSQPTSPNSATSRQISFMESDSPLPPTSSVQNTQNQNFNVRSRGSSFGSMFQKQLKEQPNQINQSNFQDKSQQNQMKKNHSMRMNDSIKDNQNDDSLQSKPKKDWVDSYTQSFQENLKRNLQEKFKGVKLNVAQIKKHLKQKVINIIPDEEFRIIPENIIKKPEMVVPQMNDQVKLFKRIVMKSISIKSQKDPNSFINKLKDKIKEKNVEKIKNGFVSHLLSAMNKNKISQQQQNREKSLDTLHFSTIQTQEKSPLMTPFSRNPSFRQNSQQQSNFNLITEVSSPLVLNRQQRGFSTTSLYTVNNTQSQFSGMSLIQQVSAKFRNIKTSDQSRKPSLSKADSHQMINQQSVQHQNYMNQEHTSANIKKGHQKSKSALIGNSVRGYNYYEHQQKQMYQQRMKTLNNNNQQKIVYQSIPV